VCNGIIEKRMKHPPLFVKLHHVLIHGVMSLAYKCYNQRTTETQLSYDRKLLTNVMDKASNTSRGVFFVQSQLTSLLKFSSISDSVMALFSSTKSPFFFMQFELPLPSLPNNACEKMILL